ncbi:MAG: choice-of-anchor D domain-containing protein [Planctomycetales bacterium]|nr:choice-of-anchor D domain-containing protein [Planctomycetales bacterium]
MKAGATAAEIDITGKEMSIVDGDTTPSTTDGTSFGVVKTGKTVSHTFTVKNLGNEILWLGTPSVVGAGFWRGAKALKTSLQPQESDTFTVVFSTTTAGVFSGNVILYNSDSNEAPYNFSIKAISEYEHYDIDIKLGAFIPLSKGSPVVWDLAPGEQYESLNWAEQPLEWRPGSVDWYFGTNDRERAGEKGGSKVFSVGSVNTSSIGRFESLPRIFTTDSDPSHRVSVIKTYEINAYKNTIQTADPDPWGQEERADGLTGKSMVAIEAGASYPFSWVAPEINYDIAFTFESVAQNATKINFAGWHDAFPAYEIIINGEVVYEFRSPDPGPTPLNLGGFYTKNVSGSVVIYQPK